MLGAGASAALRGSLARRAGGARPIREPQPQRAPARRPRLHRDGREVARPQGSARASTESGWTDMGNSYHVPVISKLRVTSHLTKRVDAENIRWLTKRRCLLHSQSKMRTKGICLKGSL